MGCADVGDHCHIGAGAATQPFDLTEAPHAHFHNQGRLIRACAKQGQGDAYVVVFVAARGPNRPKRSQGTTDKFPRGGLTGRTGHRHHWRCKLQAPETRQVLVSLQGVRHQPEGHVSCGSSSQHTGLGGWRKVARLGCESGCTRLKGSGKEAMAIEALANQRQKKVAAAELAAIGADGLGGKLQLRLIHGQGAGGGLTPELLQLG